MTRAPKPVYTNQPYGTTGDLNKRMLDIDAKEVTGRNNNIPPASINTTDNTRTVEAPEQRVSQVTGQENVTTTSMPTNMQLGNLDRATENINENILTGAMPLRPQNITIQDENGFPIARPNAEFKNSDMVSAYVQSGFNDDILNILIRTV
tara:strand:+ start:518 stop:967 length:450 start_codon:yes stop_codon:yes gene_type:complete